MNLEAQVSALRDEVRDLTELLHGVRRMRPLPRSGDDATEARRERPTEPELAPTVDVRVHIADQSEAIAKLEAFMNEHSHATGLGPTSAPIRARVAVAPPAHRVMTATVNDEHEASIWRRATKAAATLVMTWPVDAMAENIALREALADAVREISPLVEPMAASIRERIATKDRELGAPAIAKLADYAQRILDSYNALTLSFDMSKLVDIGIDDFNATIEAAKRQDAELQHLRRVAKVVGEYFVAERMQRDADPGPYKEQAASQKLAAKDVLVTLLQEWRSGRST